MLLTHHPGGRDTEKERQRDCDRGIETEGIEREGLRQKDSEKEIEKKR
jgi:hypothetical protein